MEMNIFRVGLIIVNALCIATTDSKVVKALIGYGQFTIGIAEKEL